MREQQGESVRRLRVAHIAPWDPTGCNGVAQAVLNWARILPGFGIDMEIWDFTSSVDSIVDAGSDICRVFRLPLRRSGILSMVSLPPVTRQFLSKRIEVVHALHLHSVFRPENHWAANLGLPFIVSPHNGYNSELLRIRSPFKKWVAGSAWERADLNRARSVIALNARESQDLRDYGVKRQIVQLPNVLDSAVLAHTRSSPPPGDGWVFLGRLDVLVKGLDVLLAGFAQFRGSRQFQGNRLVLAGPDARGGLAQLRRSAERLGVADFVDFSGPQFGQAKLDLLDRTAVFLHPSRSEGIPYAVLEALAHGRPVMVTASTNLAEMVDSYGAGWIVASTPGSIADAFARMATTPAEELRAKGGSARDLILREFAASGPIARRLADLYREIAA